MRQYVLTVYDSTGEKLLDEELTADTNDEAKAIGEKRLAGEGYSEYTHRLVSPEAKLVLFHR